MNKVSFLLIALLLTATGIHAQAVQPKFSYQAVVRDAVNRLVVNANLTVDISIANSNGGAAVYSETHNVTSNQNGLVVILIGGGSDVIGDLADVTWPTAFITTDFTLPDGAQVVRTVPVTPVPYALYAENVNASVFAAYPTRTEVENMIVEAAGGRVFICGTNTVKDVEGNEYNTVKIGEQCWMKENLRTSHYADGTSIPWGEGNSQNKPPYRCFPNNDTNNVAMYGQLYNWPAVMNGAASSESNPSGVQGICPTGWHLPSKAEWNQLSDYVSSQSDYVCGSDNQNIGRALAATMAWKSSTTSCAVGDNLRANNATGFSALPTGAYFGGNFSYSNFGQTTDFWSATQAGESKAYARYLSSHSTLLGGGNNTYNKYYGYSVRCLLD